MRAGLLHLFVAAYLGPWLGFVVSTQIAPLFSPDSSSFRIPIWLAAAHALYIPLFVWVPFLPLGFGSLFLFRLAASRRLYSLPLWLVSWSVVGGLSGWVFAALLPYLAGSFRPDDAVQIFTITGFVVGVLLAPVSRYFWIQLYEH